MTAWFHGVTRHECTIEQALCHAIDDEEPCVTRWMVVNVKMVKMD